MKYRKGENFLMVASRARFFWDFLYSSKWQVKDPLCSQQSLILMVVWPLVYFDKIFLCSMKYSHVIEHGVPKNSEVLIDEQQK